MQRSASQSYPVRARILGLVAVALVSGVGVPGRSIGAESRGMVASWRSPAASGDARSERIRDLGLRDRHLVIGYRPGVWQSRHAVRARCGLEQSVRTFPGIHAEVAFVPFSRLFERAAACVASDPRVAFVETDQVVYLALNDLQWNFENVGQRGGTVDADVDGPEAWNLSSDCSSVVVAVIDTGIDIEHPDLAANLWINPGEAAERSANGVDDDGNGHVDDWAGWNFRDDDNDIHDHVGHGTHVAGIIGAQGNTDVAVQGVCHSVQLMPLVTFGFKMGLTSDVVAAFMYAVTQGADIINASFAGVRSSALFERALTYAAEMGVLVVLAAGNDSVDLDGAGGGGSGAGDLVVPDNVLVVAATDRYDELADFSNYGPESVQVAAPGSSIYSTFPPGTYRSLSGTSMAVPHVSGAAALVLQRNPCMTPEEVRLLLMESSDRLEGFEACVGSGGRLNLYRALLETTTCGG